VNQVNACSCGSVFEEWDAFCANCGKPRVPAAPPTVPRQPVDDRVPAFPPPLPRPTVHQTGVADERAHGNRQPFTGQSRAEPIPAPQSLGPVSPAPFDVDSAYLQKTLRHEPMELALDDSVSLSTLGIVLLRAILAYAVVFVVFGIIGGLDAAHGGGEGLLSFGFAVSVVVFWVVLLVSKVTEPIGEWRTLLANRAGQAEPYYRMIVAVLRRRELPISPELRSVALNTQGRPVKHTIVLSENEYRAYVTVFPYGTSLYVGWQMWRRRSGAQLIKRALVDRVTAASLVTAMLRTDRARAMREAVHLACREAVYAAPDEGLWVQAQALRMPQIEQESALLAPQQPASPTLPPPVTAPPPSAARS